MAKSKKQKDPDDLKDVFEPIGSDDMELQCKHCGGSYVLQDGYDDKYCCKECKEADKED